MAGQVTLRIVEGTDAGRTIEDVAPPLTLGRHPDNTIIIDDERASRFHARIDVEGGALVLVDAGSRNGTHVNGTRVASQALTVGDQIAVGHTILVVERADIPVPPASDLATTGPAAFDRTMDFDASEQNDADQTMALEEETDDEASDRPVAADLEATDMLISSEDAAAAEPDGGRPDALRDALQRARGELTEAIGQTRRGGADAASDATEQIRSALELVDKAIERLGGGA